MALDPVRVAVVGLGRFGRLHALTLASLAEAKLVGLVARRQASLDELSLELPNVPGWLDLDHAIAESGAEAWVVASTTSTHIPITEKLLRAGKTVLLEKPVAATLSEAGRLAPLIQPGSANLMMGHIALFNSEVRQLLREAHRRAGISFIECVRHRSAALLEQLPDETPLEATMVHDLYVVQALMAGEEPRQFSARVHRTPEGRIDLVLARLQWDGGALASLTASFITPAGMPPRGFDRTEVFGPGWAGRITPNPRPIEIWDHQAHWPLSQEIHVDRSRPAGMIAEELRCFCRVVRRLEPLPQGTSYHDAMQVQHWMERLQTAFSESHKLSNILQDGTQATGENR